MSLSYEHAHDIENILENDTCNRVKTSKKINEKHR